MKASAKQNECSGTGLGNADAEHQIAKTPRFQIASALKLGELMGVSLQRRKDQYKSNDFSSVGLHSVMRFDGRGIVTARDIPLC